MIPLVLVRHLRIYMGRYLVLVLYPIVLLVVIDIRNIRHQPLKGSDVEVEVDVDNTTE